MRNGRNRSEMGKKVTLEDVARDAGVGKGTVDRVLHKRGYVSEEAREKVENSIRKLGYKLNPVASLLASDKYYRIAVIFHNTEKEFWNQVEKGIDQAADLYSVRGVQTDKIILPYMDVELEEQAILEVIRKKYDGIAVVPYHSEKISEALDAAADAGIRVIEFNNYEPCKECVYVGEDMLASGRVAGRLMSLSAPKRAEYMVLIPGSRVMQALEDRLSGFLEVIKKERPDMHLAALIDAELDFEKARAKVSSLLDDKKIDAIYATNMIAEEAAQVVKARSLGSGIRFISHDLTFKCSGYLEEGILDYVIDQEPERQGYMAIETMAKILLGEKDDNLDYYTGMKILVRGNCQ